MNYGIDSLRADVERDCNKDNACGCFNPNGCNIERASIGVYGETGYKHCFHRYCDKYKWAVERANHYAEKTGVPVDKILESWEKGRNYWYMNYYQDGNQPKIKDDSVKVFDSINDFRESVGNSGFRCPGCGRASENPQECKSCGWKSYGLFRCKGKGISIFFKDSCKVGEIFMPIAWENDKEEDQCLTAPS